MKQWRWRVLIKVMLMALFGAVLVSGCESGEKVVDEATGNRAVKQYHKVEQDIKKLENQQTERYESILDVEGEDNLEE